MTINPATRFNHYEVVAPIGAGGMGEVYLARDTKLERQVAIKLLSEEFSKHPDRLHRFTQEARAASALNHPNILTIHEIGETNGTHYIATEYIEGETLRHHGQQSGMKLREVVDVMVQVASALAAAHQAGILHRDIKPENIMLRPDGIVKVLDFGLAKLTEKATLSSDPEAATISKKETDPGTVMGTVQYMSPEQARGKTVDARTDIFSLGIVLYELIAGRPPFTGESSTDVLAAILDKEPLPLLRFADDLPQELQRIVTKCLRKDREERYQTMKDVLLDLRELRDELALEAKLERSIRPVSNVENQRTLIADGEVTRDAAIPTRSAATVPTTSSAEYLVSQIQQHRRGFAVISVVLLVGAIALGYWLFGNRTASQIESIAVMPFVNESGNQDVEYLSDGMTETLIKSLSNLPNLNVKPRSSVFRYKGKDTDLQTIAKELNVQAILNGRVAQRGGQLTLSLELVDVRKDSVIWSEQYNRKQSELVSLQNEIAHDVSTNLKAKLSGAEEQKVTRTGTADAEAYQAYLKGRYYWNRRTAENLKKAIEQFKTATGRDANYALAYAGLADCYAVLHEYAGAPTAETVPQAKAFAERALSLDGQLAEPHATLGSINESLWQWTEAEKEFKTAIELNPNYPTTYHWYSIFLKNFGRNDEAAAMIKRANELDPLSSVISVNVSREYLELQHNYEASVQNTLKIIEIDPNFAPAYEYLGLAYLKLGRNAEAVAALEKAAELTNRAGVVLSDLGNVYAATGKRAEAIAVIKELEEKFARKEANGQFVAAVYAGLGDKDKAFEWLEKDFQIRNGKLGEIRWTFSLQSLRDDPRFKDLLRRMGLPE
jgi:serine/threonine protein kinase/Tfp pilus assembly protein PilF